MPRTKGSKNKKTEDTSLGTVYRTIEPSVRDGIVRELQNDIQELKERRVEILNKDRLNFEALRGLNTVNNKITDCKSLIYDGIPAMYSVRPIILSKFDDVGLLDFITKSIEQGYEHHYSINFGRLGLILFFRKRI